MAAASVQLLTQGSVPNKVPARAPLAAALQATEAARGSVPAEQRQKRRAVTGPAPGVTRAMAGFMVGPGCRLPTDSGGGGLLSPVSCSCQPALCSTLHWRAEALAPGSPCLHVLQPVAGPTLPAHPHAPLPASLQLLSSDRRVLTSSCSTPAWLLPRGRCQLPRRSTCWTPRAS